MPTCGGATSCRVWRASSGQLAGGDAAAPSSVRGECAPRDPMYYYLLKQCVFACDIRVQKTDRLASGDLPPSTDISLFEDMRAQHLS